MVGAVAFDYRNSPKNSVLLRRDFRVVQGGRERKLEKGLFSGLSDSEKSRLSSQMCCDRYISKHVSPVCRDGNCASTMGYD